MFFLFKNPKTLEEAAKALNRPYKIRWWLWFRVNYRMDLAVHGKLDYFQPPEETLRRRTADCEDVSWLAQSILKRLCYEAYVMGIDGTGFYQGSDGKHAVCVFKKGRTWYHISNWGLFRCGDYFNAVEAAKSIYSTTVSVTEFMATDLELKEKKVHFYDYNGLEMELC